MNRRLTLTVVLAGTLLFAAALSAASLQAPKNADTWQIPPKAAEEKNPVAASPDVLRKGAQLFNAKCSKCHGEKGKGDGPEGDADHPPGDLTDSARAEKNPDGVMFYKIWNGRSNPKMPAFKTDIPRNDVWTVIHFVKTLRQ